MKARQGQDPFRATAKFTDREEPRKAFWNSMEYLESHRDEFKVLSYYGFGGIGKTRLCLELSDQLQEKDYKSIFFSFEHCQDCPDVLRSISNLLTEKYHFNFSLFRYALYLYYRKQGDDANRPEIQALQENCFVNALIDVVGMVPVIGSIGSMALKYADKLQAGVRDLIIRNKEEIQNMEGCSAEELRRYLPYYFAREFNQGKAHEEHPMVIFLDTYEQVTNMIYNAEKARVSDDWLHGMDGVIMQVPNVLWVVAGQSRLRWGEQNGDWNDESALEQHCLGELGEDDVRGFLSSVDITDPDIVQSIWEQTSGVPIHLDLCVGNYYSIKDQGGIPKKEDFSGDLEKLAKRFIGNLQGEERDLLELLSCMESWREEDLLSPSLNVSDSVYQRVKTLAFILQEGGVFYFHKAVRDILYRNCGTLTKERFRQHLCAQLASPQVSPSDKRRYRVQKLRLDMDPLKGKEPEAATEEFVAVYKELRQELLDHVSGEVDFSYFFHLYDLFQTGSEGLPLPQEVKLDMCLMEFAAYSNQSDFTKAGELLKQVQRYDIRRTPTEVKLLYYKTLAVYYKGALDWQRQLQCWLEYRTLCESMPDKEQENRAALQEIANSYRLQKRFQKATEYAEKFIQLQEEVVEKTSSDQERIALAEGYLVLARCFSGQSDGETAISYLEKALSTLALCDNRNSVALLDTYASVYQSKGDILRRNNELEKAFACYEELRASVDRLTELSPCKERQRDYCVVENKYVRYYINKRQYDLALEHAQKARDIAEGLYLRQKNFRNFDSVYYAIRDVAEVYSKMQGQQAKAFELYEQLLARLEQESLDGTKGDNAFWLYDDMAVLYDAIKDYKNMKLCLEKMGEILEGLPSGANTERKYMFYYERWGIYYGDRDKPAEAISFYQKEVEIKERRISKDEVSAEQAKSYAIVCHNLAIQYRKLKQPEKEFFYSNKRQELLQSVYQTYPNLPNLKSYEDAVEDLALYYEREKTADQTLTWMKLRYELKKKIYAQEPTAQNAESCFVGARGVCKQLFRDKRFRDILRCYDDVFPILKPHAEQLKKVLMWSCYYYGEALYQLRERREDALQYLESSFLFPECLTLPMLGEREDLWYRILMGPDSEWAPKENND